MKHDTGAGSGAPLTPAVQRDPWLFVSGQVPINRNGAVEGGIREQTRTVLDKIDGLLVQAGFSRRDVVKTTVFLRDRRDFAEMNAVYREFFEQNPPARSTVEAGLMIEAKVEIEAITLLTPSSG